MDSLFASANYRSFFRHRVKESGYNRGRWRTWTAEMHRGVRVGGSFPDFTLYHDTAAKSPGKGVVCYSDSALCVGEGGREGGAACVSAISVPPVPCPDRNESHGNTTVRSGTRRPCPSVRSSRPFCVQLGASLEIMLREHPSQPRSTLNGQDADRKIRKAISRNSLTCQVQVIAAVTI